MSSSNKKISVCISFRNEGDEVAKTCEDIRKSAGDKVDIILLNDASNDGFDYETSIAPYDVDYHYTETRIGSSLGKEYCIQNSVTPYFLLLDGHCRIYTPDWLEKMVKQIEKEPNAVYCCSMQPFTTEEDHQSAGHGIVCGSFFNYDPAGVFSSTWSGYRSKTEDPFDIPCILGANYFAHKEWWNHILGHQGLRLYGREESFVSKKSLMAGGSVKCLGSVKTGHKISLEGGQLHGYRSFELLHNEIVMAYMLLSEETYKRYVKFIIKTVEEPYLIDAVDLFDTHIDELKSLKEKFASVTTKTYEETEALNKQFQKRVNFKYERLLKNFKYRFSYTEKKVALRERLLSIIDF